MRSGTTEDLYLLRRTDAQSLTTAYTLQATRRFLNRQSYVTPTDHAPQREREVRVDDTERGILGAEAHECNMRSKFR